MDKIRLGVIGVGWMGAEHARNILANEKAELVGIADQNSAGIDTFCAANGCEVKKYSDYRELLRSDIDGVVIASPNAAHAEMSIAAAEAGKAIYCEKPMAINVEDCKRIRDAVERADVKYLIGYHRRFNPLYRYAKDLVTSGSLGNPFMVESDYLHYVPGDLDIWSWLGKADIAGSILHAGGGHNIDLIRYFCGEIKEVVCFKDTFLPRADQVETEDTSMALFRFENGAIGKIQCCLGPIVPFTFNFKLFGTGGTVVNNRVHLDSIPRFEEEGREEDAISLPKSWVPDNVQGGISEPWNLSIDHFVDMILHNAECINDITSAYQTSMAAFAAVKSAQTHSIVTIKEM